MIVWGASSELYHHGIKGQKWGNRRYQNEDGSLTEAGKKRYGYGEKRGTMRNEAKRQRAFNESMNDLDKASKRLVKAEKKHYDDAERLVLEGGNVSPQRENQLHKNFVNSNNAYVDAANTYNKAGERSVKILRDLNISENEFNYRKAKRNFDNYMRKNTYLLGPIGAVVKSSVTKKGRAYTDELNATHSIYKQELERIKASK